MALVLAEGVVEVTADTKGVGKQIAKDIDDSNDELGKSGERAGQSVFGGIMKSAAVLGGLAIVGEFIGGSIGGASDLNETMSKSNTIFGESAKTIDLWSQKADKALGLSREQALNAAAGFGNMFTQLGYTSSEASAMSQTVVQAAADLGSFNNLETSDVADRMSAAFRGEYDSLQALIPNINAARVEQEAMAATGKTAAAELTAQEKAAAVLAIVQKDGAAAMGDFARTADGAANTQKTLTASLADQQAELGQMLLPIWQEFLGFLTDVALPGFTWFLDNLPLLAPIFAGLGVAILVGVAPAIWAAVAATWAWTAALLANPITWIVIGIGLLVAAIVWLVMNWDTAMKFMGDVFNWLWTYAIKPVVDWIVGAFNTVAKVAQDVFSAVGDFIGGVWDGIVNGIKNSINWIIGIINSMIDGVNVVGGAFGVKISHIPMLAKGGNVVGGGLAIVGERGPELLNLPTGARVTPLSSEQRRTGTGTGNTTINVYEATDPLGSAGRVAAELRKFGKAA